MKLGEGRSLHESTKQLTGESVQNYIAQHEERARICGATEEEMVKKFIDNALPDVIERVLSSTDSESWDGVKKAALRQQMITER